jgi:ATP-dependent RNA helicase DeaD
MTQLTGIRYKGRTVRCNSEDDKAERPAKADRPAHKRGSNDNQEWVPAKKKMKKDDWRSLMNAPRVDFKGEEPDFSEEGWARRKPKKKNK